MLTQHMKHWLAMVAVLLCSLTMSAYDFEMDGIYYNIISEEDLTVEISGSSVSCLTIPNNVAYNGNTYRVISIGYLAFNGRSDLTSVSISESVTLIGSCAFYSCSGLTTVIIPDNVMEIGMNAFQNCTNLTTLYLGKGINTLSACAFYNCNSLTFIVCDAEIPPSIGWETFGGVDRDIPVYVPTSSVEAYLADDSPYNWNEFNIQSYVASGVCGDNLTWKIVANDEMIIEGTGEMYDSPSWDEYANSVSAISIREGVTSIGMTSFWDFGNLTTLTIPRSLTSIGRNPFYHCVSLSTIKVDALNTAYVSVDDNTIVDRTDGTIIVGCSTVPEYDYIQSIGEFAYCGRDLSSIIISPNIRSIGYCAFGNNENLSSITIPESVTNIGAYAFFDCGSLTSINIPEGVTNIGDWTFYLCKNLTSITIPNSVTELGNLAFADCESVTSITCKATNPPAAGNSFQGIDKSIPVYVPAESVSAYQSAGEWCEFTNIQPIEVPTPDYVTITISKYGSDAYSSAYALDFTEVQGLKAYVATGYNHLTGVVTLLRVHTADAATGLLVKGTPGVSYEVPILESTADHTLNMLVPTLEKTPVNSHSSDGVYANYKYTVVKEQSPEPLFYQFADGASLSAGKAYLQIPVAWLPATGQRILRYRFDEGETTDIEDEEIRNQKSEIIYDLHGRRVENPTKPGIYIVNGRKVLL